MIEITPMIFPSAAGDQIFRTVQTPAKILRRADGQDYRYSRGNAFREYEIVTAKLSRRRLEEITAMFITTNGGQKGFLFSDPHDYTSDTNGYAPDFFAQSAPGKIGTGDGVTVAFQLVKQYGQETRKIRFPEPGTVRTEINDIPVSDTLFSLGENGMLIFNTPPANGAILRAAFQFYTPCQFTGLKIGFETLSAHIAEGKKITFREILF